MLSPFNKSVLNNKPSKNTSKNAEPLVLLTDQNPIGAKDDNTRSNHMDQQ